MQTHSSSPQRVLVVEERLQQRLQLTDWLTQGHCQVDELDDPALVVGIAKHGWPGVIVAGHIGGMSAQHFAQQVHAQDPAVPIILIDNPPIEGAQACLSAAATKDQVLQEVTQWLNRMPAPPMQTPGTILLVDDDERLCSILQNFFELNAFSVVTAPSGEEAVTWLKESPVAPKVILLDVRMPGIGGLEALWQIRQLQPRVPVIVISNLDDPHTQARACTLRINAYLLKPVNFEYLKALLHSKILWGSETKGCGERDR